MTIAPHKADDSLAALGGRGNVVELEPGITRLRVEVSDPALVDDPVTDRGRFGFVESGGGEYLFDGHIAVEQSVVGEPDRTHTAASEFGLQAIAACDEIVGADGGAGAFGHGREDS